MAIFKAVRIDFTQEKVILPRILSQGGWKKPVDGAVLSEKTWKKIVNVLSLRNGNWQSLLGG